MLCQKKSKNKKSVFVPFFPLLHSSLAPKGKGGVWSHAAPALPGQHWGGGRQRLQGWGPRLSPSCWEVWETWVPAGSELPPTLYQKQHRCLANVTLPHASQLGGLLPPTASHRPFPSLPPSPAAGRGTAGWGMVGCARERVAVGLEGTRQGHQWVMPRGEVLTQPIARSGTFADQAISSLAPLVTFYGAAPEMPVRTPFACPALRWGWPGARLSHGEHLLPKHGAI